MKILEEVLKKLSPSEEEKKEIEKIVKEIKDSIEKIKPGDAEAMLVGSVAKDTYLKSALDIDFFVLFPTYYKKEEMQKIVISIGKEILKEWKIQYAEHPYIRGFYKGYMVDIVPCYRIKSPDKKMSAVDRTPFHTEYIKKNLKEEMKNEVRLLKQFLKGIGCYGAEAKIEGFSGYLVELLILKYGSFLGVLKNAKNIKSYFIDPVDESRNVAAALSKEKLEFFIEAADEFLKKPKIEFFFPNPVKLLDRKEVEEKIKNFVGICFKKPEIVDDILYPQLKKAAKSMENLMKNYDFEVVDRVWYANDEVFVAVKLKKVIIDEIKLHVGPPLKEKEHVKIFIEKWKNSNLLVGEPFEMKGKVYVKIKRKYTDAISLLKDFLYELNLGKNINDIRKEIKICDFRNLSKFVCFWSEYLCEKKPWQR
ncbi:MAG: CCA tRNA nucleotidyltransferase [Thermoplasmatales archaeon]|nr:CCA tRNA nucleotidyltransferase [Thermoplasmatales archaeon]